MSLLAGGVPGSAQAAEPAETIVVGRSAFSSQLRSTADGVVKLDVDDEATSVNLAELVAWGALVDVRQGPQLLLADGGLLVADIVKLENERLAIDSTLFGAASLPLEGLAGILFFPPADPQRRDRLEFRVRDATADVDRLILDNGDELTGTVLSLTDEAVELESSVGKIKVETSRTAALIFNPTLRTRPPGTALRTWIGFRDGSRLLADSLTHRDATELTLSSGVTLKSDAARVAFLQPIGGRATYLSDIKPAGYRHVPFLELPWQWQADRNVLGTRLRAGSRLILKGIGMHSASRLSFRLDGSHRRFESELAIDGQTEGRGSVVFRVFFDAEPAYASPVIRGGDAPLPLSLEIPSTAKSLSLIVDFAERGDEQDHANWLNARLVE